MENLLFFRWQNNISLEGDWFRLGHQEAAVLFILHTCQIKRSSRSNVHLDATGSFLVSFLKAVSTLLRYWESESESRSVASDSLRPHGLHGILQARALEWEAFPSPGDLPNPGMEPRPTALQADSLPAEPQGKPKNTGVGSLSLLLQIFPTQELNQRLLHRRQILYQLRYQGSRLKY